MTKLNLKGGHVIDPSQGTHRASDVTSAQECVLAIGDGLRASPKMPRVATSPPA